jgi:hypothetical protein
MKFTLVHFLALTVLVLKLLSPIGAQEAPRFKEVRPADAAAERNVREVRPRDNDFNKIVPKVQDSRPPSVVFGYDYAVITYQNREYAAAAMLFRPLAAQGRAGAQYYLGFMYANGQGVLQDYTEAVKWYRLAADQGHPGARYGLGLMYASGQGVVQDVVQGFMWLDLAARQGLRDALKSRDALSLNMTPAQRAEAEKLARQRRPPRTSSQ